MNLGLQLSLGGRIHAILNPAEPTAVENFRLARNAVANVLAVPSFDIVIRASQTSGPAPMGVVFNMLDDSTFPGITRPEADLSFWLEYDDVGSTYQNVSSELGRNNANIGQGAIHGHVFDSVKTYTVKGYVYQHSTGKFGYREIVIAPSDADAFYPTTNTVCLDPSGVFSGAPSGSQQVTTWAAAASAIDTLKADSRLLIAKGAEINLDSTSARLSIYNHQQFGSFGEGEYPVINLPVNGMSGFSTSLFYGNAGTSRGTGEGTIIYEWDIKGNYSPVTGVGETKRTGLISLVSNSSVTIHKVSESGVGIMVYPYDIGGGLPSNILLSDVKFTDWFDLSVFGRMENSVIVGSSIKQNVNAVGGIAGGKTYYFERIAGDGVTLEYALNNLAIFGDTSNLAVFDYDTENQIYTELTEANGGFVFTAGADSTIGSSDGSTPYTGNGTHSALLTAAIAEGHELYYHKRYWAFHGPIRLEDCQGVTITQSELFSNTGWSSDGLAHQSCIRWNSNGTFGAYGFINQNKMEGGISQMSLAPQNQGTRQHVTRPLVIESNLLYGYTSTENSIGVGSTNLFIRNNVAIQFNLPSIYPDHEYATFAIIEKRDETLDDVDVNPIVIANNSVINLMSTANSARDTNVIKVVDGNTGFPLVTDVNNLLYHEDRPTPWPIDYAPLYPDIYYQPLAGSPAIGSGVSTAYVWDDILGALVEDSYNFGAFDSVSAPVFELTFNPANSTKATFSTVTLAAGEKVRFTFKCLPAAFRRVLIEKALGGGSIDRAPIEFNESNNIAFNTAEASLVTIDAVSISNGASAVGYMDDDEHILEMTINTGQTSVFGTLGSAYTNAFFYNGVIKDLEFDKFVEGELTTVLKWDIDSGSITTEPSVIGTADLTFVNFVEDDWTTA
ncbi:hypothetical protein [Methylophaga sp.]|uniref:hypothetical protein n=1 Tax=Methylophaga sp. TaxID=2024840 RepID=UPI003A8F87FD